MDSTIDDFESLRIAHRPPTVQTLFVGESRPVNGTFFFRGDSNLSRYTCLAFERAYGPYEDDTAFLAAFRAAGYYLVDFCPEPVAHLPRPERLQARRDGIPAMAAALRELRPERIVIVMKAIQGAVAMAAERAECSEWAHVPRHALPFPAMSH